VDLRALVTRLSILTKDIEVVPFVPNWAQEEFLAVAQRQLDTTGRVRIITLKARQLGISTVTEAMLYCTCHVIPNYKAMVMAHEVPASQNLLAMTQRYWDTDPLKPLYSTKYEGQNKLAWETPGVDATSSMTVATAGNKAVGRSATIHGLHASEVAYWPEPKKVWTGLAQTIPKKPGTIVVIESTAQGVGNFFEQMWNRAVNGESEYEPLFFPWHRHPEYTAEAIGIDPTRPLGPLDQAEQMLREMGISDSRLWWRRHCIRDECDNDVHMFDQEYPATPEMAFVSSGTNVYPHVDLTDCYHPEPGYKGQLIETSRGVHFEQASDGPLTIYRAPSADPDYGQYLVAGDPTRTTRGDFACVQVLNRRTLEQVAEWRARITPAAFADVLFQLGVFYNNALITSEIEGPGYATIGALIAKNYPYIYKRSRPDATPGKVSDQHGWSTTKQSKHMAVGWTKSVIVAHDLTIHSSTLYAEMKNYVVLDNGEYGPASKDGFDDTVMAMNIAVACHMLEPPPMPYAGGASRAHEMMTAAMAIQDDDADVAEPDWMTWNDQDQGE